MGIWASVALAASRARSFVRNAALTTLRHSRIRRAQKKASGIRTSNAAGQASAYSSRIYSQTEHQNIPPASISACRRSLPPANLLARISFLLVFASAPPLPVLLPAASALVLLAPAPVSPSLLLPGPALLRTGAATSAVLPALPPRLEFLVVVFSSSPSALSGVLRGPCLLLLLLVLLLAPPPLLLRRGRRGLRRTTMKEPTF